MTMHDKTGKGIRIFSAGNIIAMLIPGLYFFIAYSNPGFGDPMWPYVVWGLIIAILSAVIGITFILMKTFGIGKIYKKEYFAMGLINLCFGLVFLLLMAFQEFVPGLLSYALAIFLLGAFICIDAGGIMPK